MSRNVCVCVCVRVATLQSIMEPCLGWKDVHARTSRVEGYDSSVFASRCWALEYSGLCGNMSARHGTLGWRYALDGLRSTSQSESSLGEHVSSFELCSAGMFCSLDLPRSFSPLKPARHGPPKQALAHLGVSS